MKTYRQFLVWALLVAGCAGTPASVTHTDSMPASIILDQVAEIVRTNKAGSVVVFDLDDTLFDARSRSLLILKDFAALPETKAAFPDVARRLSQANIEKLQYDLDRTFASLGIDNPEALKAATAFWVPNFFSDKYCAIDEAISGAVKYVKIVHGLGGRVVYLSGRDVPRMKKGTLQSLKKHGFPLGKRTELVLKPDPKMDDLEFKKDAIARIEKMGDVVAVFENEPKNLNLMGEAFPKAVLVFLDTRHSKAPDVPTREAHWVKDFLPSPEN